MTIMPNLYVGDFPPGSPWWQRSWTSPAPAIHTETITSKPWCVWATLAFHDTENGFKQQLVLHRTADEALAYLLEKPEASLLRLEYGEPTEL